MAFRGHSITNGVQVWTGSTWEPLRTLTFEDNAPNTRMVSSGRLDIEAPGGVVIDGNVDVLGTLTSVSVVNPQVSGLYLGLAVGVTTPGGHEAGIVVNHDAVGPSRAVAGGAFLSATQVEVDDATGLSADDVIEVANANTPENEGRYAIASILGNVLTIKGSPNNSPVLHNAFIPDAVVAGTVTKVALAVLRCNASGVWEDSGANSSDSLPWSYTPTGSQVQYVLGEVRMAPLTEAQWTAQAGSGWVLADGRSVAGTPYAAAFAANVPDMRGRFPRARDNGAGVNPDGEIALGGVSPAKTALPTTPFAADSAGAHTHTVNSNGAHTHSVTVNTIMRGYDVDASWQGGNNLVVTSAASPPGFFSHAYPGGGTAASAGAHSHSMSSAGAHTHNISGGDNETAGTSVTLNFFIYVGV